jgi:hypothetical protein
MPAEGAAPPVGVRALEDATLDVVSAGGVAVLVGPVSVVEVRRTRRNMRAHLQVLEAAMTAGPLLPMRFGVVAADADAVRAAVAPRSDELQDLLRRHAGLAEFGVRVRFPREAALAALAQARPDLAKRRAEILAAGQSLSAHQAMMELGRQVAEALDTRRKRAERAMLSALVPLADSHVLGAPEEDVEALRAEFLLPLAEQAGFERAVAEAAAHLDFAPGAEPAIHIVGPAPAYNFVSLALDAAA